MASKKHPRLPNGYGSITKLSGKRKNPWCVRPPITEKDGEGNPIKPKPICYTDTWTHGFAALTAWKAGTYKPGMESEFSPSERELLDQILADYVRISRRNEGLTFGEVYEQAAEWYRKHKDISDYGMRNYKIGFNALGTLHKKVFVNLTVDDLQQAVDAVEGKSLPDFAKRAMILCYKYAITKGMVQANLAYHVMLKSVDVKHGTPFSEKEIEYLWKHYKEDEIYADALIMIYSGFRKSAYKDMEVNLKERYFKGGIKTKASKGRIVPIHDAILPLVKEYGVEHINANGGYLRRFYDAMERAGMKHSPHDCRHTFSALCERYEVRENDRKRLLGHAIGDITNDVYGHRTLSELRTQIDKICCPTVAFGSEKGNHN